MADDANSTTDIPADQPWSAGSLTSAPACGGTPARAPEQPSGVVAMVRLAAVLVDPDGRIALWNRAAEELFGHRTETVRGRTATGLLPALEPRTAGDAQGAAARRCDAFGTLEDLTRTEAWSGLMPVTDREERSRSVLWWAYPLVEPEGRSLLALATDARPLRVDGPRIATGRRLLPYAASADQHGGFHRIAATLAPPGPSGAEALAPLLPRTGAARRRSLLHRLATAGVPALWVDAGTRLPVVPYEPATDGVAQLAPGLRRPGPPVRGHR
ncbi:PAS domain-containing protein, partial [Kitasatospora nipponensis]